MDVKNYELTKPQQSIWDTELFNKGTAIGNICGSITIQEKVDFEKLEKAINLFVQKNDSFKIKLHYTDNTVKQYFSEVEPFHVDIVDVDSDEDVKTLEREMSSIPFKIVDSLLFTFKMFKFKDNHGGVIINAHHLIADAWTAGLTINRIIDFYNDLVDDSKITSYADYIHSELEYFQSEKYKKDKEFWNELFTAPTEAGFIPGSMQSSEVSYNSNRKEFIVDKSIIDSINSYCSANKISIFNFFMAVYSIYIGRVSNMRDFTIGTPVLNRTNFKEKQATGMFISTVPVKIDLANTDFTTFVSSLASEFMHIFRHQKYPYQDLLHDLRKIDSNIPKLYNIMISYQNARNHKQSSEIPYDARWLGNNCLFDDMNIHLYDINDTGSLSVAYDYLVSKYSLEDITALHNRILHMVEQVISDNNVLINDIDIVTPEEKDTILHKFNDTLTDYPKNKSITELFEEQVEKTPNNIALVCQDKQLTYKELNSKANSLAHYLIKKGVQKGDIVAIMVNRSLEMIVSMLAILKAGACYLPVDPEYPEARISYIIENSQAKFMLSKHKLSKKCESQNAIFVDLSNEEIYSLPTDNVSIHSNPEDLAYVIYTSGSTGLPKGVMLTHHNINNFIQGMTNVIDFAPNKAIVSITTICFDIFVLETWLPLQKGLKIVLATEEEQTNMQALNTLCLKNNVNIIQTTPSRYKAIISNAAECDFFRSITDILVGGEPFPASLLSKLKEASFNKAKIYNVYGPTETAVWSTVKDITNADKITIGTPIANTYCYILDENKKLLPVNTPGNLFIGGEGLAAGYYKQPELTAEKFIENPYMENQDIYDTGDLAYFTQDGELVHLGRNDFQVKIRGYRVELGEIEEVIAKYQGIKQNVVVGKDNRYLICYYISDDEVDTTDLTNFLMEKLPTYMVPTYFQKISKMPMTPNGKIDKKHLPEIKHSDISKDFDTAKTDTEKKISQAIKKLLEIENEDIDINAPFLSLGLDSLNLIQLQGALVYLGYNLTTQDFYKYPNVKKLADFVDNKVVSSNEVAVTVPNQMKQTGNFIYDTSDVLGNVFVTGANGFIGIHVINEILNSTDSKVYCLVRGKDKAHSTQRFIDAYKFYFNDDLANLLDTRVFVVNGDVTSPDLYLSNSDFLVLKDDINTIIHSAAIVKHYGDFNKFLSINIEGTKNVANFALDNNKRLIHLSSLSVSGNYLVKQDNSHVDFTENDLYIGQHYTENVYVHSKYQCEQYIFSMIEKGLTAKIIRLGIMAGRYLDGAFQSNIAENAFYSRIKSMVSFSSVSADMLKQRIEFTPIDACAKAIVKLSQTAMGENKIFHLFNHNLCTIGNVINRLKLVGIDINVLSQEDFNKGIIEMSKTDFKNSALQAIANDLTVNADQSVDLNYDFSVNLKSDYTQKYLQALGFSWPDCNNEYIDKLLTYMRKVNFI